MPNQSHVSLVQPTNHRTRLATSAVAPRPRPYHAAPAPPVPRALVPRTPLPPRPPPPPPRLPRRACTAASPPRTPRRLPRWSLLPPASHPPRLLRSTWLRGLVAQEARGERRAGMRTGVVDDMERGEARQLLSSPGIIPSRTLCALSPCSKKRQGTQ
ncbi:hypothetical protein GUJ93_ZPchr0198g39 [Zizania palustris]|uniref:Uncharacterized protein n=1 Tax=Zizania palustris TaxID=103762 RepID=A0A8J5TFI7_ZIZPA|nr:hypothetical protein GUJ93_ZPchr0198g39 [Zizania palustris]